MEDVIVSMKKPKLVAKIMALALVCAMLCGVCASAVWYDESPPISIVAGGKTFNATAMMYHYGNGQHRGAVWINTSDLSTVPAGTMYGQSIVYYAGTNNVYNWSSMEHNTTQNFQFGVVGPIFNTPASSVEAGGVVDIVIGSQHNTQPVNRTVPVYGSNANGTSTESAPEISMAYAVNERGETYGTVRQANVIGAFPDLIAAVGLDGKVGYIRFNDAHPTINNETEFALYRAALEKDRTIPLYNLDGEEIGRFEISEAEKVEIKAESNIDASDLKDAVCKYLELEYQKSLSGQFTEKRVASREETEREQQAMRDKYLVNGKFPTTADGLTYGPLDLMVDGQFPDLVMVSATKGKDGYARLEDFSPMFSKDRDSLSEQEYLARIDAYNESILNGTFTIPLYDLSGNIVGEYSSSAFYPQDESSES